MKYALMDGRLLGGVAALCSDHLIVDLTVIRCQGGLRIAQADTTLRDGAPGQRGDQGSISAGATRAASWPERRSASAMKPLAFRSSMTAARNLTVSGLRVRRVPTACRICMKASSISRNPGWLATKPL